MQPEVERGTWVVLGREGVFAELFGPVAVLQCCHPHTAGHTTAKLSRTPSQALTGKSGLGACPWSPLRESLFWGPWDSPLLTSTCWKGGKLATSESGFFCSNQKPFATGLGE